MDEDDEKTIENLIKLLDRAKGYFSISPIGNLTLNEISALLIIKKGFLNKGSDLTMSEAGELLGLCRSAMSQLVSRLERKGMLKREIVLWDRRKTTVKLTETGRNVVESLNNNRLNSVKCAVKVLGKNNINEFIRLFTEYLDAVEVGEQC